MVSRPEGPPVEPRCRAHPPKVDIASLNPTYAGQRTSISTLPRPHLQRRITPPPSARLAHVAHPVTARPHQRVEGEGHRWRAGVHARRHRLALRGGDRAAAQGQGQGAQAARGHGAADCATSPGGSSTMPKRTTACSSKASTSTCPPRAGSSPRPMPASSSSAMARSSACANISTWAPSTRSRPART